MPSIAAKVRNLVYSFGELAFSTAQVLSCGGRNAVDIALCRLVKENFLAAFLSESAQIRTPKDFLKLRF